MLIHTWFVSFRKIGQSLATLDSISVVTGGFYGVGESVGKAFYEETQKLWRKHKVWHIVPEKDPSVSYYSFCIAFSLL